jgi:hypothetical protein
VGPLCRKYYHAGLAGASPDPVCSGGRQDVKEGRWDLGFRLRVLVFSPWIPVVIGAIVCVTTEALPRTPAPPQLSASPLDVDAIVRAAGELPRLHSLLVSWRGSLIVERYFNGARPARLSNIKSASKSVISALIGIAIERLVVAPISASARR